jgi:Protein of unknown function (DUF559)
MAGDALSPLAGRGKGEGELRHDLQRPEFLHAQGYQMERASNEDVDRNLDSVLETILARLCGPPPHPCLLPARGEKGRKPASCGKFLRPGASDQVRIKSGDGHDNRASKAATNSYRYKSLRQGAESHRDPLTNRWRSFALFWYCSHSVSDP